MDLRSYCTSIIRWQLHYQCMVLKMEILLICFVHLLENKPLHSTRNYWALWWKSIEFCIIPFNVYRISEKENRGHNGKIDWADQMQHWVGTEIGKTLHQWQTRTRLQKYYGIAKFLDFKCQSLSRSSQNNPLDTPEIICILSKLPVHLQNRWKWNTLKMSRMHSREPQLFDLEYFVENEMTLMGDALYSRDAVSQYIEKNQKERGLLSTQSKLKN